VVDGQIGREAVEISVAVHIPQPHALAPREDDREGRVVMGAEFSLDIERYCSLSGMSAARRSALT
jgi:hypothetical protein